MRVLFVSNDTIAFLLHKYIADFNGTLDFTSIRSAIQ